jgi:hypothetical protein
MISEQDKRIFVCGRLQHLGYRTGRCIKLYGEEFELVSGPSPDGSGYGIDGIAGKSGDLRHVRIPLLVTRTIENEFYVLERLALAS